MKRRSLLFLTTFLLQGAGLPALAQSQEPAPVVVPPLPPSGTAPAASQPTSPQPAPAVLLLTSRPGTYAEYTQVTQLAYKVLDMQLSVQPGKSVKPADLAAATKDLSNQRAAMQQMLDRIAAVSQSSKLFMKVLPPQNGNTVLLSTAVLMRPDPLRPQQQRAVNVRTTMTYDLAGKLVDIGISASDPQIDQMYRKMDIKTLIQNAQTSGPTSLYGLPLIQGAPQTQDVTLPMQGLMQGMMSMIGAQAGADVSAQALPLMMHVGTTYDGLNAQNQHTFSQTLSADPWNVTLNINEVHLAMKVQNLTGGGTSIVRQDGFLQSGTNRQAMTMQMSFDVPGEPYRLQMTLQYDVNLQDTLKTLTQP
ncbi:hypothetical protein MF271_12155 [Deinococcus sp. KNUC1210]|uniref:hypothetical protein n=1 Tax=Deinococcus sp. KNUC1210 TaxID=2917691 RepID=UPI001EEF9597|nr:hypothetical protein [Deinococcus sp. KNUC1210]ULH14747.1 hypothetical protein MF271_12155 [Deinococcus sp. KNUC1210]